jgi:hypothetical protein
MKRNAERLADQPLHPHRAAGVAQNGADSWLRQPPGRRQLADRPVLLPKPSLDVLNMPASTISHFKYPKTETGVAEYQFTYFWQPEKLGQSSGLSEYAEHEPHVIDIMEL